MQIGCHGLVWSGEFGAAGVRTAVEKTRAAGFDFIEFPLMDPDTFAVDEARAALEACQLESTASLGLDASSDVSSEDPTCVAKGAALLHKAVEVAAGIGAPYVGGVIYSAMQKYMDPATPAGIRNSVAVIQEVADHAADLGISLGLEVVNRYESNVLNTGRQALAFVNEVDRSNVVIHLDTYHMNIEESDPYATVLACGERLGYFHVGENHRGYLGSGSIDFGSVFAALAQIGYDGPDRVRVLLIQGAQPEPEPDARHLAGALGRQRGACHARRPHHPRASPGSSTRLLGHHIRYGKDVPQHEHGSDREDTSRYGHRNRRRRRADTRVSPDAAPL